MSFQKYVLGILNFKNVGEIQDSRHFVQGQTILI